MVVILSNRVLYEDKMRVSTDGRRRWGQCQEKLNTGLQNHGTRGFDSEEYLCILGGHRTIASTDNVLKS